MFVPNRQKDVLFVVSEDCDLPTFNMLLHIWKALDNNIDIDAETMTTNLYLSDQFNMTYFNTSFDSNYDKNVCSNLIIFSYNLNKFLEFL